MSRRIIAGGAGWPTCQHLDSGDCAEHAAVGIRYSRNGIRENGPSQWTMEQGQLACCVHLLPPGQSAEHMWSNNNLIDAAGNSVKTHAVPISSSVT
jgi:hypothetical protein